MLALDKKTKYTLFTTLIFLVVINPETYKLVDGLLKNVVGKVANSRGCPTEIGTLIHAFVFTVLLRGSMELNIFGTKESFSFLQDENKRHTKDRLRRILRET